ncbi:MAG: sodium:proton antiporter NhaD [Candidatus Moraniibacteriota bacterium]
MLIFLVGAVFVLGYAAIVMEHQWRLHKTHTALFLGSLLWVLIALFSGEHGLEEVLGEIGREVFELVAFLLAAMTLVEILIHYQFFDFIRTKIQRLQLTDSGQLWLLASVAFFLSAIIDNLTTTIVMIQIARRFFRGNNLLVVAAAIVIAANAGGAFSPIGDITTIMLWLAGKFSAGEILAWGFLPSLTIMLMSGALLSGRIKHDTIDSEELGQESFRLTRSERIIVTIALLSFSLPLMAHFFGLPPYMGLLLGLGATGIAIAFFARIARHPKTHLAADIERLLKSVDYASILFFVGILLAVGALRHLGILADISAAIFGSNPETWRLVAGNTSLGFLSAVVDNIPLTAAAIDIVASHQPAIWVLLALTAGTGGSLLVIGSAAGVVAMGMIKELSFRNYFDRAFVPALFGYIAGIAVWFAQYMLFG